MTLSVDLVMRGTFQMQGKIGRKGIGERRKTLDWNGEFMV